MSEVVDYYIVPMSEIAVSAETWLTVKPNGRVRIGGRSGTKTMSNSERQKALEMIDANVKKLREFIDDLEEARGVVGSAAVKNFHALERSAGRRKKTKHTA